MTRRHLLIIGCTLWLTGCSAGSFDNGAVNIPKTFPTFPDAANPATPSDVTAAPDTSVATDTSDSSSTDSSDTAVSTDVSSPDVTSADVAAPWTLGANTSLLVVVGRDSATNLGLYTVDGSDAISKLMEFDVDDGFDLIAGVPGQPFVVVADNTKHQIRLISLSQSGAAVDSFSLRTVGFGLVDMVVTAAGTRLLVVSDNPPTLAAYKIDVAQKTLTFENSTTSIAANPKRIALLPNGSIGWITGNTTDTLTSVTFDSSGIVSAKQDVNTNPGPFGIAVSPNGSNVLVVDRDNRTITPFVHANGLLSPNSNGVIQLGQDPAEIAISPNGNLALVTDAAASTNNLNVLEISGVSLIDGGTKSVGATATRVLFRNSGTLALVLTTSLNKVTPLAVNGLIVTVGTAVDVVKSPTAFTLFEF